MARRADICTSLVYKWRRDALKGASAGGAGFAPVVLDAAPAGSPSPPAANAEAGVIVVEMRDARVRIGVGAPSALIAATLQALRS